MTLTAATPAHPASADTTGGAIVDSDGFVVGHVTQTTKDDKKSDPRPSSDQKRAYKVVPPPLPGSTPKLRWEYTRTLIEECNVDGGDPAVLCPWDPDTRAPAAAPLSRGSIEGIAREVVATLQLPQPNPQIGPDPTWNEWNKAVIGHPLWLWTEGPRNLTASNTDYGITVTLDARHTTTSFTMGDGTTRTCATTTPYVRDAVEPGAPSPTCGHTYQRLPQNGDIYPVTATSTWSIAWTAGGFSGTLPASMSASRDLPVTELQAVVVRR